MATAILQMRNRTDPGASMSYSLSKSTAQETACHPFVFLSGWLIVLFIPWGLSPTAKAEEPQRPNILFIAMDDLNDWIGILGGHPQTLTPNLDRLAGQSVLFTNAHCVAPACNPSRTAIFTGRSPHRSGLYDNRQRMRDVLPDAEILPKVLSDQGYYSAGSGKMLHYFIDAPSWDEYFPAAQTENPFPRTYDPPNRPLHLPRAGPWQYVETDWGPIDLSDVAYGGDYLVTEWVSSQLQQVHDQPFFLACGIYRPHEPWFVPAEYFKPFPLESIELPPGYRADDLEDLPPQGKRRGPNRYFEHIRKQGQWKQAIQAYLASIHYADAMLGRVLDALESSPNAKNTIVVLWSDHGWHLGEKEHWQKYTGWRACTRVPLMISVPPGTSGMPAGTTPGSCSRPVSLLSLFPTLLELSGLPARSEHDGPSLLPLLTDPKAEWPHAAITYLADPGSYSVSHEDWRLIHYANGEEELYEIQTDPFEWTNLANDASHDARRVELRMFAPRNFADKPEATLEALTQLPWQPVDDQGAPNSRPDGGPFDVFFINQRPQTLKLYWMSREGVPKFYAELKQDQPQRQQTRPGAVWVVQDQEGKTLGYFRVDDRSAKAVIPR
jgi:arylsulfatase A-like enzyme